MATRQRPQNAHRSPQAHPKRFAKSSTMCSSGKEQEQQRQFDLPTEKITKSSFSDNRKRLHTQMPVPESHTGARHDSTKCHGRNLGDWSMMRQRQPAQRSPQSCPHTRPWASSESGSGKAKQRHGPRKLAESNTEQLLARAAANPDSRQVLADNTNLRRTAGSVGS